MPVTLLHPLLIEIHCPMHSELSQAVQNRLFFHILGKPGTELAINSRYLNEFGTAKLLTIFYTKNLPGFTEWCVHISRINAEKDSATSLHSSNFPIVKFNLL